MKLRILFFILFGLSLGNTAFAAEETVTQACMKAIAADKATFSDILFKEIMKTDNDLTQQVATKNKAKILHLIAGNVLAHCADALITIASDSGRAKIPFEKDGKKYAFDFSIPEMIDYIEMRTGIMVYNKIKNGGEVIKLSDIPKLYWSDECSDHTIWDNLDDDAAVNVVGQRVFSEHGGSDNEYFLDFEEGNDRRAFPGLVLIDVTWSTEEKIAVYQNLIQGREKAEAFASGLKSTACSGQGLYVYQVAIDVQKTSNNRQGWAVAAGVTGGTMALIGVGAALVTTTFATATTGAMAIVNAAIGYSGLISGFMGPVGWIAAGVLGVGAATIAMIPTQIQDIKQVMVISGPYKI